MCLGALRGEHSLKVARSVRAVQRFPLRRPTGGLNLIDSESFDDGTLFAARQEQVGNPQHTHHYADPCRHNDDPSAVEVPPVYQPTTIAGIQCYSNMRQPNGMSPYYDGSLKEADIASHTYNAAGAAVTKGPLCIFARAIGPQ